MNAFFEKSRHVFYRARKLLHGDKWWPHVPIALIVIQGGLRMLNRDLGQNWSVFYKDAATGQIAVSPQLLPLVLIGGAIPLFGLGLLLRSRIAWIMTLLLVVAGIASTMLGRPHYQFGLMSHFTFTLALLLLTWRHFDRASLAAGTLFALTAIAMLLFYGTFGSFYLGQQFKPPIADLLTAFYFAIVTMCTVGYGDITPGTTEARLFAVSIILLGVAVFATSLTAVIAPMISNSINRIISRKDRRMKRENHFIVVGNSPLAANTCRELAKRGRTVTRILDEEPDETAASQYDIVVGDANDRDVLREAGAANAECVLAMKPDDSENAFIVLAVREISDKVQTVVRVNDSSNIDRVHLVQPDIVIAPDVFGGELLAMMLSGQTVSTSFIEERIFQRKAKKEDS